MDVLSYNFDVKKIHDQCIQLLTTYGNDTTTQLGLKHTTSGHSRNLWFEGVGTSFEDKKRFSVLNELLKGTYIEEVHDTIASCIYLASKRLFIWQTSNHENVR